MRAHKKFNGSTVLFDLNFLSMFRVIDLRNGDEDDDSDGTLFQSDGKTLSVYRMAFAKQTLFIKSTEILKKSALKEVGNGFW